MSVLRITRVLAPNPGVFTLEGTNTWVVGRDPSIVIDPGPDDGSHLDEVADTAGAVGAVVVTHDHEDHAPGAAGFAARVGAPLYAFRLEGAHHLSDGQAIRGGSVTLVAVHTPGHSSDHVALHLPDHRAVFTGDAVLGRGTSFIDPPDGDLASSLRSLARMRDLAPRTLYPGHGPVVLDGVAKLQECLDYREERERQVLDAMTVGARTINEIVTVVYESYPAEVHALAARSVLAHLLKLVGEGRAARSGTGEGATWQPIVPRECERCGRSVRGRMRYCSTCTLVILQEGAER
jgi:glyoxylase-like metal-dependent hydrolase (beta-lactamase superfamily II)